MRGSGAERYPEAGRYPPCNPFCGTDTSPPPRGPWRRMLLRIKNQIKGTGVSGAADDDGDEAGKAGAADDEDLT